MYSCLRVISRLLRRDHLQNTAGAAPVARLIALAAGLLLGPLALPVNGDSLDAFHGKTLTYIVPGKPGGGYDRYARLLARHLPQHLPVSRVVVRNSPGAGGLLSAHQVYQAAPDGLTIGTINSGILYAHILEHPGLRFELGELNWIGKSASDYRVLVTGSNSDFTSLAAIRTARRTLLLGTGGAGGASYNESRLLLGLMPFDARLIPGFRGDNARLAIRRGDIDGKLFSYTSARPLIEAGEGQVVLQVAGSEVLDARIPRLREVVSGKESGPWLDLLDAVTDLGRLTAAPPGLQPALLDELRRAYAATLADPRFLADAASHKLSIAAASGEEVTERLDTLLATIAPHRKTLQAMAGGTGHRAAE